MPDAAPSFFCAKISDGVNTPDGKTPLQQAEAATAAAPFLFLDSEMGFEKLEAVGEFTGERLLARRPETYRAIVRMLAEGLSGSSIARACQVSRNTVTAVREREGFSIEQSKKELLATIRRGSQVAAERVVELIPHIQNAKDAAITLAVLVDKAQLLAGEATSRVERVDATEDKLRDMLASLPVLEAEVIQTGLSEGAPLQKGAGLAAALPALPLVETHAHEVKSVDAASDYQRLTQVDSDEECNLLISNEGSLSSSGLIGSYQLDNDPDQVKTAAVVETPRVGGEGVADFEGGVSDGIHSGSQKILSKGDPSAPAPEAP